MTDPFDPFIAQTLQELASDGASEETISAAQFGMQKAQLMFAGDPTGTLRVNSVSGASALRVIRADGAPIWKVTFPDGTVQDDMQAVLQPSDQWTRVAGPVVDE